jgi:hypothetical protein
LIVTLFAGALSAGGLSCEQRKECVNITSTTAGAVAAPAVTAPLVAPASTQKSERPARHLSTRAPAKSPMLPPPPPLPAPIAIGEAAEPAEESAPLEPPPPPLDEVPPLLDEPPPDGDYASEPLVAPGLENTVQRSTSTMTYESPP